MPFIQADYQNLTEILSKLVKVANKIQPKLSFHHLLDTQQQVIDSIQLCSNFLHKQLVENSKEIKKEPEQQMYQQIEEQLQKQQSINRNLIKKQFQNKEYEKRLIEELDQAKANHKKTLKQLSKSNGESQHNNIDLLLWKKEKKNANRVNNHKKSQDLFGLQFYGTQKKVTIDLGSKFHHNGNPRSQDKRKSEDSKKRPTTGLSKKKNSGNTMIKK